MRYGSLTKSRCSAISAQRFRVRLSLTTGKQVRYHVMRDGGNETIPVPVHALLGRFRITGVTLVSVEVPADMGTIFYMVTED